MEKFYTYLWLREDGTPYYAGKGIGKRAFLKSNHCASRPKDETRILVQEHDSEQEAFVAEKFLIAYYGRKDLGTGCLRNLTDGGEGTSGSAMSKQAKEKLSIAARNRSQGWRERQRKAQSGKMMLPQTKVAIRAGFVNMSEESKQKMITGYRKVNYAARTPEHCAKISAALKGRKASAETKAKLSAIRRGRKLSPEHSAAIRAGILAKVSPERRSEIARHRNAIRWGRTAK